MSSIASENTKSNFLNEAIGWQKSNSNTYRTQESLGRTTLRIHINRIYNGTHIQIYLHVWFLVHQNIYSMQGCFIKISLSHKCEKE